VNQYPGLVTHAGLSLRTLCALQTERGQISYGALSERCIELRSRWANSNAKRVGVWASNELDTLIGIHALNTSGRSVALLRKPQLNQQSDYVVTSGVDHILSIATWDLEPVGAPMVDEGAQPSPWVSWGWDDTLFFVQTSGTTGRPQWLPLTTRQVHLSAFGSAIRLGHLPGDQWLNPLAPGYMGWLAVLTRCALYGTTMRVCNYTPTTVSVHLDTAKYTQLSLVPSMLSQLIKTTPHSLRQARTILVGGGPTSDALLALCRSESVPVITTWGMTETASQVATQHLDADDNEGHVGPPMPFIDISIQNGRFVLNGPLLNEPLETRDIGTIDAHGQIHVHGRIDDVILSSGHKVLPNELESRLMDSTAILDACVFGIEHKTWGQLLCAVIVPPDNVDETQLTRSLLKLFETLPSRLKPRRVWQVDHIPANHMRKPLRSVLSRTFFQFDETMRRKPIQELTGQRDGLKSLEVDGGVGQTNTRPQNVLPVNDVMAKDQRAISDLNNSALHPQFIALPDGFMEVTLGINEGQTDRMCVKELIPVPEDRKENFFESDMGVFEDTTKKNDASAVNLVESGSKVVTKSHDVNLLWSKGKAKL
jgi:o-succinylbenzoate---CoA ligase